MFNIFNWWTFKLYKSNRNAVINWAIDYHYNDDHLLLLINWPTLGDEGYGGDDAQMLWLIHCVTRSMGK